MIKFILKYSLKRFNIGSIFIEQSFLTIVCLTFYIYSFYIFFSFWTTVFSLVCFVYFIVYPFSIFIFRMSTPNFPFPIFITAVVGLVFSWAAVIEKEKEDCPNQKVSKLLPLFINKSIMNIILIILSFQPILAGICTTMYRNGCRKCHDNGDRQ